MAPENGQTKVRAGVVKISQIRENPVALRNVDRQSEEYLGLVDSIKKHGILNAISVRELPPDPEKPGEQVFGLVDGLHRFSGAKDAGLEEIPVTVQPLAEAEILEAQIIANVQKIETKPVEYSKQLFRILAQNPLITESELASRLSKSPAWLGERLGLVKLTKELAVLVDEGKINLSNAYALAKLPHEEQPNFTDRAMTMAPAEFVPTVQARMKEIRDAKRQGKDSKPEEFVAVPHLRKIGELKDELNTGTQAKFIVKNEGSTTIEEGFAAGIRWALHMDKRSIEEGKQKDDARRKELAEQKLKREKERAEKKQKEAASTQQDVTEATKKAQHELHKPLAEIIK